MPKDVNAGSGETSGLDYRITQLPSAIIVPEYNALKIDTIHELFTATLVTMN